jgi:hypothetical protein
MNDTQASIAFYRPWPDGRAHGGPVCTDNLNAGVAVMKSAQDGA